MSLIAWYKLDGNALDSSGNGRDGATVGTPNIGVGKIASAYSFDYGSDDGISIPNNKFPLYDFTMTAWIKPVGNHYHYDGTIISSGNWNGSHWSFGVNQSNTGFSCRNPYASGAYTFTLNTWHFVVYRREGTNLKLYANNTLVYNSTVTTHIPLSSDATNTCIGRETYAGGYFGFNGSIDDVRIYDHALSEKEIKELAKAKVLHYTFDEFQEPTENLLYDNGTINWTIGNLTGTFTRTTIEENVRYRITSGASSSSFRFYVPLTKLTNGKTYTLSYNYSIVQGTTFSMSDWCDTTLFNRVDTAGYSSASGTRVTYDSTFRFMDFSMSADSIVEIWNVQIEQKDHATPFINGTRTGSVSDNSGYDNHADLALATTPQWTSDSRIGKGCYKNYGSASVYLDTPYGNGVNVTDYPHTFSMWVYPVDGSSNQMFFSTPNGTNQRIYFGILSGKWDMGIQASAWGGGLTSVVANQWSHVVVVMDGSYAKMYINGEFSFQKSYTSYSSPSNFKLFSRSDYSFNGYMDDVRIHATALSADDVKELYNTRAQIDNRGNVYSNQINEYGLIQGSNKVFYKNIVSGDYSSSNYSVPGDIAGHSMSFNTNANFKTYIGAYSNPYGDIDKIINYYVPTTHYVQYAHPTPYYYFTVDPSKTYRYTQWIYRHAEPSSSYSQNCYLGIQGNTVCNNNTTTLNSNPYFTSPAMNDSAYMDKWVLQEFYIFPYGSTGNPTSGKLNYTNGTSINNGGNYNWASGITSSHIRQYPMYEYGEIAAGSYVMHYRPRLDIVDGTEPSIAELVSCGEHVQLIEEDGSNITEKKGIDISGVFNQQIFSEIGPTNGLVAYYPLNGDAKDYANANDGTVNGAIISTGINGKACYSFDGVDDSINCGDFIDYSNGFTLSSWINPDTYGTSNYGRIVDKTINTGTSTGFFLYMPTAPTLQFMVNNIGGITASANSTPYGSWTHIIAQVDSAGNCKIYINGALNVSGTTGPPSGITATTPLTIGNRSGATDRAFDGKIQNVRIYNRALSPEEISILYDLEKGDTIKVKMDKNTLYVDGEVNEAL